MKLTVEQYLSFPNLRLTSDFKNVSCLTLKRKIRIQSTEEFTNLSIHLEEEKKLFLSKLRWIWIFDQFNFKSKGFFSLQQKCCLQKEILSLKNNQTQTLFKTTSVCQITLFSERNTRQKMRHNKRHTVTQICTLETSQVRRTEDFEWN
jgi:hypothetical protein